jgi:DNA-directed RNA polymerase beta subunit
MDKIKSRGRGGINTITHQPDKGRARNGGLRVGEMEHDSLVSHGATGILQERLLYVSDKFSTVVCRRCGLLAVTKYGISYYCGKCDEKDHPVKATDSTVGDKFGSITFPFAFKAVCQMLNGIGVQAYFETEATPVSKTYTEVASIHRM